ncbi:MAG: NAD-glutamate dehydrogenase domain-containing protein, partial [Rhodospirillaceae bacterium]
MTAKSDRAKVGRLVRALYSNTSRQDLSYPPSDVVAGAAAPILPFSKKRRPVNALLRFYNPEKKKNGWDSEHTIIEAVTDDMPFLVDSITSELGTRGITVHLVIHPIVRVVRNADGSLKDVVEHGRNTNGSTPEAFMSFEITRQSGAGALKELEKALTAILADVKLAVQDWQPMRAKVQEIIEETKLRFAAAGATEVAEAQDFLQWAHDDHFTFLGYREYDFKGKGLKAKVAINKKSGLGVLRDDKRVVIKELRNLDKMPAEIRALVRNTDPVVISKADVRSTVHRAALMDTIAVKKVDKNGNVIGERLIVGLFTSVAYSTSPRGIPLLRRKIEKIVALAGFPPTSHDGKALLHILETYPRDELFQTRDEELLETSMGILHLQERQRVAMFTRFDNFGRYASVMVYVPRDNFTTRLRLRMQAVLEEAFEGQVLGFNMEFSDSALARLHVTISLPGRYKRIIDTPAVEEKLSDIARSWSDRITLALTDTMGEETAVALGGTWADAFPSGYTETFSPAQALADIAMLERVAATGDIQVSLYRPENANDNSVRFKMFHAGARVALSEVLPMLEHLGLKVLDEVPFEIRPAGSGVDMIMIHDFGMVPEGGGDLDVNAIKANFEELFTNVWQGDVESDRFNALVLNAGLDWRRLVILRTYAKYLKQANAPFSQEYMEEALRQNPKAAAKLIELFEAHFDPALKSGRDKLTKRIAGQIEAILEDVQSADHDRILRRFLNAIDSTLRTNYYQTTSDGGPKPYLSIKLDSRKVDELPLPRPLREIFVYAPRFEAIHLRGGMVARGGLRWSDRPEDFRTEILGLMK